MVIKQNIDWTWKSCILFVGLMFCWAMENFILQAYTSAIPITRHPIYYQAIRFVLDTLAAAVILLVLNRIWLIIAAIMNCLLSFAILSYSEYFHNSLSAYYGIRSIEESLHILGFAAQIIPKFWLVLLIVLLFIKIFWIFMMIPLPSLYRRRIAVACALLF